ncbi:hypothetical protein DPMN_034654 [Dreissena polymorpha]|uniref:Uncharacterized protein n=1 Tax=Dreissena polymorpha TaxID=45954 RepID=A0A9D4M9H0_DREPO|nr:hypothetical protein DPMN_034654 [Dreissena polymorpha]
MKNINILTKFHKDWMKTINILTKFHKDWMKTVTSTVYTNKLLTDGRMHVQQTSHDHISSPCHFVTVESKLDMTGKMRFDEATKQKRWLLTNVTDANDFSHRFSDGRIDCCCHQET